MLGIDWDLFQGGPFDEACVEITNQTERVGLEYRHCVVSDEPDVFFALWFRGAVGSTNHRVFTHI